MNPELLNELKQKTRKYSLRNRFSSSGLNSPEYLELSNIDIEKNTINPENDFDFLPPPILNELPEELSEDYYNDIRKLNKKINYKLCCFGFFIIMVVSGLGAIYKIYII